MKITDIECHVLLVPDVRTDATSSAQDDIVVFVHTDEGITGVGESDVNPWIARACIEAPSTHSMGLGLKEMLIGEDPLDTERLWQKLYIGSCMNGRRGAVINAIGAIDMALWDIKGKALGQSVCSLLGGYRKRVPTYASGALMRPMNLEQLAEIGPALVEKGFKQMKSQMGAEDTPAKEVLRMRTLREAVGDDIDIMCDINQLWNVNQAITIGSRVEEYNLFWLEDVVAHDDYQGLARVADALNTPIAAGEYVYGINPFRQLIENRSIDIVMIDLLRVGGITEWRKVAGMAEAFNLPVVSHLVPEIHIQLMGAIPNGLTVEYMPWTLKLFEETPKFVDGCLEVPDKPGLGLKFSEDAIKQYAVS